MLMSFSFYFLLDYVSLFDIISPEAASALILSFFQGTLASTERTHTHAKNKCEEKKEFDKKHNLLIQKKNL
jgi:hypothetical protein